MSAEAASASPGHEEVSLVRNLGLFDITMIGVGAMIGAGIFVLTGIAAGEAGPALVLSFALNGVITVFTAMVYAELGSAIPEAGGGYLWIKEGLPGPNAFLAGWMSWFAHAVAGSLYGVGFGGFAYELMRVMFLEHHEEGHLFMSQALALPFGLELTEAGLVQKAFAVLIILLFLYINYRGSSETGLAGNIVTVLQIVVLLIFVGGGIWAIFHRPEFFDNFQNFAPNGIIGIASAMGLTFIAFEGYEIIVQAGEEVKEPRKNIPRAVFLSLAIVVPLYMLVAFALMGATSAPEGLPVYEWLGQLKEVGIARAATQFMPYGTFLILIGGLLATMSSLNATTFSSTRVSFAMGRDKSLPDGFAEISRVTRTPYKALIATGVLILAMAVTLPIEDVAAAADIMFLLLFLQVNVAVITLRRKYGVELSYGYLMPFFPIVPIIGIVTKLLLALALIEVSIIAWIFSIVWIIVGFWLYYIYARPRQEKTSRTPILQETTLRAKLEDETYNVLVSMANPASLESLMPAAIRAAQARNGKITVLHVITVPAPSPLSAGRQYIDQTNYLREQALRMAEAAEVNVEFIIRVARQVAPAILDTVRETRANLLIMGWRGQSRTETAILGRNIDQVIEQVGIEMLMVQPGLADAQRFLLPVAVPRQTAFALASIARLTAAAEVKVDVFHVFAPSTSQDKRDEILEAINEQVKGATENLGLKETNVNVITVEHTNPVEAIIEASARYDYVVVGATRDSWLKQQFFGNKPVTIARQTTTPVALLRPPAGVLQLGLRQTLQYLRGGYAEVDPESRERLREHGFLEDKPQPAVDPDEMEASVNTTAILLVGIFALVTAAMMWFGQGDTLTWIGGVGFFLVLWAFTWISVRGPSAETSA